MKQKHLRLLSQTPLVAQVSQFQIKLDFTTQAIDRLLLVPRQSPWKVIGGEGTTDTDTDTTTITDLDT